MMNSAVESKRSKGVLPGDKLAAIEEFEAGSGSAIRGDQVVASIVGKAQPDMSNRIMQVKPAHVVGSIPKDGDIVIGTVESASSSVAQITIKAINDVESNKEFSAMLSLREDRHRRSSPGLKANDTVRALVMSTTNSILQLSIECESCGVVYTVCSVCGGDVIALGKDRIKCKECGTVDERILSPDFVTYGRIVENA
jgi:exosome complex component CSL4